MTKALLGLDGLGLTESSLRRMGSRRVEAVLHLNTYQVSKAVSRLPPSERHEYLARRVDRWIKTLKRRFPVATFRVKEARRDPARARRWFELPTNLTVVGPARALPEMARSASVQSVFVSKVPGHRRRRRSPEKDGWFCVRAAVAVRVEGVSRGLQTVEDRFVLVRASDFDDAERRLRSMWREYAEPYLNPQGRMVSWALEEVVDVFDTMETELDPRGTEVYSKLHGRRLRPGLVWRPRGGRGA
jgi:hypothetical protein